MGAIWNFLVSYFYIPLIILAILSYRLILRFFGVVMVPHDSIGIVNKRFVLFGAHKTLPDGAIIALNGEAGYQADTLAPGVHFFKWPWQYEITFAPFVKIESGSLAVVEAKDGIPLSGGNVLARRVECDNYQNARDFLKNGGQRGPQITIIPPGTYRINSALFSLKYAPITEISDNMIGIVTTKEGQTLPTGQISGQEEVPGHAAFQEGDAFVRNGGYKGLQTPVMLAGKYFINPLFASVEIKEMTVVPIAHVGVVIAYVGRDGVDVSGMDFKHGNLVKRSEKGVWVEPLDPGKYPINPYTHKIEIVPTANVVLNWATGKNESHQLDANLSTITVRSIDGFTFNLDVSQIIHIPRNDAPLVIARFGSVSNLVSQVLEPTIGNYFRNSAQRSDVIEFLRGRKERQDEAREAISRALAQYNVNGVDTLIGDITPPADLMKTLTDRKIAEQEQITYETQRQAEGVRKDLMQATALADTQKTVVDAERTVQINTFKADAQIAQAKGNAESKQINARADAEVLKVVGAAEGAKIQAIGVAEADVIKLKIESMESGNFAAIEVAKALAASQSKWVPDIVAGGAVGGNNGIVDTLMALMLKDQLAKDAKSSA